jgi:hypothetical protein
MQRQNRLNQCHLEVIRHRPCSAGERQREKLSDESIPSQKWQVLK